MYAPNQGEGWNGQQEETDDILIENIIHLIIQLENLLLVDYQYYTL